MFLLHTMKKRILFPNGLKLQGLSHLLLHQGKEKGGAIRIVLKFRLMEDQNRNKIISILSLLDDMSA